LCSGVIGEARGDFEEGLMPWLAAVEQVAIYPLAFSL